MSDLEKILLIPQDTKLAFIKDNVNKLPTKKHKIQLLQMILDGNDDDIVEDKKAGCLISVENLSNEFISHLYKYVIDIIS